MKTTAPLQYCWVDTTAWPRSRDDWLWMDIWNYAYIWERLARL